MGIVLLKIKDKGVKDMSQTSGCLKGVDEATGAVAGKSPTRSNAEFAPLEPPPPQPNLLQRQVFLVSKCKNLYKNHFVNVWTRARQGPYFIQTIVFLGLKMNKNLMLERDSMIHDMIIGKHYNHERWKN